ncbi:uncharacterized protein BYT42DRAFT_500587 [Radiomyces spectabilis]|uniref:uncharacterized protein n=1 Tax=Radiomyces spectabilis TaxID=64574 RepID=UPI00221F898C|nr:uncharacterized protein BYT42DRAFT_500587 [Radiomyces spectabilis]KAI8372789.1 hypothetical protein BYT42DRAFT_500587 [Radiomyces spectabilis]
MAAVLPVILIGAPIGYFTWTAVYNGVDRQVAKLYPNSSDADVLPAAPMWAATTGSLVSFGVLAKASFPPPTRHRLFFAKAPPNANIRIETLKMATELLIRSGIVFYGAAAGGALAGRVAAGNGK